MNVRKILNSGMSFEIMDKYFLIPISKAKIERPGTDCIITGHAKMIGVSFQAAKVLKKKYDISCEIINLYSIRSLDRAKILESIRKTHRIVSVDEDMPQCGIGSEISASIMETEALDWLYAPMGRLTGADILMPY